ncbi:MAG: hypothetical protein HY286_07010 [Planctomycetes bacterium]|nr:hypothetical protein [Planctomycetota bacterium]
MKTDITKMEYLRDVERVRELQAEMLESLAEIERVCEKYKSIGLPVANYQAYVFAHLKINLTAEHGFLSRDLNLSEVVEAMEQLEEHFDESEAPHE